MEFSSKALCCFQCSKEGAWIQCSSFKVSKPCKVKSRHRVVLGSVKVHWKMTSFFDITRQWRRIQSKKNGKYWRRVSPRFGNLYLTRYLAMSCPLLGFFVYLANCPCSQVEVFYLHFYWLQQCSTYLRYTNPLINIFNPITFLFPTYFRNRWWENELCFIMFTHRQIISWQSLIMELIGH